MATAYRPKALEYEADSPRGLAWRMSSYQKDPTYIRAMVMRDYGRSPTVNAIGDMIAAHKRNREMFSRDQYTDNDRYNPENDNGEPWRPASLVTALDIPRKVANDPPKTPVDEADIANCEQTSFESPSARVLRLVGDYFGLKPEVITGKSRKSIHVSARFVAIQILFGMTYSDGRPRYTLTMIGKLFGGRDHSTIHHAVHSFEDRGRAYPEMVAAYEKLVGLV